MAAMTKIQVLPDSRRLSNHDDGLFTRLRRNARKLYELPSEFWAPILGPELHFHLGHFSASGQSLTESMRAAVARLAARARPVPNPRVLDVGCGWGGPAFQLAAAWGASVRGLTLSQEQITFVCDLVGSSGASVTAEVYDAEERAFTDIGDHDVLLLYESIDHIWDRDSLIGRLRNAACQGSWLLIATTCRANHVPKDVLYNEFMGIHPLDTADDLERTIGSSGWRVLDSEDCTEFTWPVWDHWITNTYQHERGPFAQRALAFRQALMASRDLYERGMLCSVQLSAVAD